MPEPNGRRIYSAGTHPQSVHPLAVAVMKEVGVDMSHQYPKSLGEIPMGDVDLIVTVCDSADEISPAVPIQTQQTHWPLSDPALAEGDDEQVLQVFRMVRDEIRARVQQLLGNSLH